MYEELKAALNAIEGIQFTEYAWNPRPTGNHGTYQLDFHAEGDRGDDAHQDQAWEGSVDIWTKGQAGLIAAQVETALETVCEGSWSLNSVQAETDTRMLHREYVFQMEAV